jgi:hypothetical protein
VIGIQSPIAGRHEPNDYRNGAGADQGAHHFPFFIFYFSFSIFHFPFFIFHFSFFIFHFDICDRVILFNEKWKMENGKWKIENDGIYGHHALPSDRHSP